MLMAFQYATALLVGLVSWALVRAAKRQPGWRWALLRLHALAAGLLRGAQAAARCACCRCSRAGTPADAPWHDPAVFRSPSVLPAHAPLRVYDNPRQALRDPRDPGRPFPFDPARPVVERRYLVSPWTRTLDSEAATEAGLSPPVCGGGGWHFRLYDRPADLPGAFPPNVPVPCQLLPDVRGDFLAWSSAPRPGGDADGGNIRVPGCWEMQGHGVPIYTNLQYPWLRPKARSDGSLLGGNYAAGYHAGRVPQDANPTGLYRRVMELPDAWQRELAGGRRRLVLSLGAVASACRIFVNGADVGYAQDSFTETEVDITEPVLARGAGKKHLLGLQVMRWSDGAWMEDQDHWWLSGVHRSVELQCRPAPGGSLPGIQDYAVTASKATGVVSVRVKAANVGGGGGGDCTLRFTLLASGATTDAGAGVVVAEHETPALREADRDSEGFSPSAALRVAAPHRVLPWTPETPHLYTLTVELLHAGSCVHCEVVRVGFRDVAVAPLPAGQNPEMPAQQFFTLNGVPLVVCGANYHEHDRTTGKTITEAQYLEDLLLMKRANFNAVRCCHYPHARRFYELCDELGLLVCDEANIETHGFAMSQQLSFLSCHPGWRAAFVDRVRTMCLRARNYACICQWSLGNESGYGPNHEAAAAMLRALDGGRTPLQYEGGRDHGDAVLVLGNGRGSPSVTDFVCPMYDSPAACAKWARDPREVRPVVLCEYLHAMGNSSGNSHVYWDGFWEFDDPGQRALQGGYVWDWVDQALVRGGKDCYGGDFGPTSGRGDAQFCINGLVFADRSLHPGVAEVKYLQQPLRFSFATADAAAVGSSSGNSKHPHLIVLNRYRFTDLSQVVVSYRVVCVCAAVAGGGPQETVVAEGRIELQPTPGTATPFYPGGSYHGRLSCPWRSTKKRYFFVDVQAAYAHDTDWCVAGHVVARDRLAVDEADTRMLSDDAGDLVSVLASASAAAPTVSTDDAGTCVVRATTYVARFDAKTGTLLGLYDAAESFEFAAGATPEAPALRHNFYRAATDNDKGGLTEGKLGASMIPIVQRIDSIFGTSLSTSGMSALSFAQSWRGVGLDRCVAHTVSVPEWTTADVGGVTVPMLTTSVAVRHPERAVDLFHVESRWTFCADEIATEHTVRACATLWAYGVRSLPRVGLEFCLNGDLGEHVRWLGRGPDECYPDRKRANALGVHGPTTVKAMHVPYVVPGENGGRADCRWVELKKVSSGHSIAFLYDVIGDVGPPEMPLSGERQPTDGSAGTLCARPAGSGGGAQVNLSRFTVAELDGAAHDWALPDRRAEERNKVLLSIDTSHMGVGGDTAWSPEVHQQYQVSAKAGNEWRYRVRVRPSSP